jgi:hypothetical protein
MASKCIFISDIQTHKYLDNDTLNMYYVAVSAQAIFKEPARR